VNSHVWRGPVNIGFTGPGRALNALGSVRAKSMEIDGFSIRTLKKVKIDFYLVDEFC
jgi:hypothetical protein